MSRRTTWILSLALAIALPAASLACLWDTDTLEMERKQFPQIAELISGKFLRHSKAFYEWRIKDRLARLETVPNDLALYDDLAVAYDKTGQHDKAIETILKAEDIEPDRYETLANLGTFHIHNGDLETGLGFIEKAIEINPDAHFGREVYQKLLVEYVLEKRGNGPLPQPMSDYEIAPERRGFARFVMLTQTGDADGPDKNGEIEKAVKGVSGMMRFGHHDSPILLEAIANLLTANYDQEGAKRLASRAWLKASYEAKNATAADRFRKLAEQTLEMQVRPDGKYTPIALKEVEEQFQKELAEANEWFAGIKADEAKWIANGANVDEEFARKYYDRPVLSQHSQETSTRSGVGKWFWNTGRFILPFLVLIAIQIVWLRNRRMRNAGAESSDGE